MRDFETQNNTLQVKCNDCMNFHKNANFFLTVISFVKSIAKFKKKPILSNDNKIPLSGCTFSWIKSHLYPF
jgi:hypothetical protein